MIDKQKDIAAAELRDRVQELKLTCERMTRKLDHRDGCFVDESDIERLHKLTREIDRLGVIRFNLNYTLHGPSMKPEYKVRLMMPDARWIG